MHIFVTILILIVMLGILISTHEAGHLLVAKRFGVYCDEYSIGFGPKLFSHKKRGAETTFSIRAIPLGGYVSMYGEGANDGNKDEDDRFANIPPERSLEGVAAWKRCLILVAGIAVNLLLSFLFCIIYAVSFPDFQTYQSLLARDINVENTLTNDRYVADFDGGTLRIGVSEGSPWVYGFYIEGDEDILGSKETQEDYRLIASSFAVSTSQTDYGFVLDTDAILENKSGSKNVLVTFYPSSERSTNDFFSCLTLYTQNDVTLVPVDSVEKKLDVNHYPDFKSGKIILSENDKLTMNLSIGNMTKEGHIVASREKKAISATYSSSGWNNKTLKTYSNEYWLPFGKRLLVGCMDWVNFFPLIGEGIASIFTSGLNSVGGVVAMGAGLSQLSSYMGWGKTFFYYGGLISLNLAIFNLLPFPGLDGWGLLVTLVEKVFKKKIPQKAKSIVSLIGLGLLMVLGVFITIKDIFQFLV